MHITNSIFSIPNCEQIIIDKLADISVCVRVSVPVFVFATYSVPKYSLLLLLPEAFLFPGVATANHRFPFYPILCIFYSDTKIFTYISKMNIFLVSKNTLAGPTKLKKIVWGLRCYVVCNQIRLLELCNQCYKQSINRIQFLNIEGISMWNFIKCGVTVRIWPGFKEKQAVLNLATGCGLVRILSLHHTPAGNAIKEGRRLKLRLIARSLL